MYYVYAISSQVRPYTYVGLTNCYERRTKEHQQGKSKTTRSYQPFVTFLIEFYPTRLIARQREKYLKSGIGKDYLKSIKQAGVVKLVDTQP